jgi:fatty-acyl-CoA synthase
MIGDLPDLIARRAALSPDRIALEDAGCRILTYAELDARAERAAGLLRGRGIGEGDRVAILCRNRIAFFELLFACAKLGAVLVPLDRRMPGPELDLFLADCTPQLLLHDRGVSSVVAALKRPIDTIDLDTEYEGLMALALPVRGRSAWPQGGVWYLIYTSGTTGRPKGVIYTFGMAAANAVNIGNAIDLRADDSTAMFLPNFHTAGINLHALPTLMRGGRVLVVEAFDADRMVGLFQARRVDTFFAVPTVYQSLIDHPDFAGAALDHVRHWGCGGAPFPPRLARQCRALGLRVCNGMGMTETGPTALLSAPEEAWTRPDSVGKPQLLVRARIVDANGCDVPEGEIGELLFAGPAVTPGYWNNPEATRAAFTADGWLRSGDLARRDSDGFYYAAGRLKEMFISGGENVFPAEVETVLAGHPAIGEAAVIPAPHEHWGEIGRAYLRLAGGALPPSNDELAAFCRSRLAAYKVPKSFEIVADFPRTPSGKVQKHLLAGSNEC